MAGELILIVEDNEKNRKLLRDTLRFKGYETLEAETGEDGVRLATERRPALVLMDVQLPGIDGVTALGRLRVATEVEEQMAVEEVGPLTLKGLLKPVPTFNVLSARTTSGPVAG